VKRVLVTGGSGFIGRPLCQLLSDKGYQVRVSGRHPKAAAFTEKMDYRHIPDLGPDTDWEDALQDIDCVVHLAARVHVMRETDPDPAAAFDKVNVAGSQNLALQAAKAGVRRLVFLSTVKVNGEMTTTRPFTEDDPAFPLDAYAISKYKAEQALMTISNETGLDVVIIRPPLVYGPGVKGNFKSLIRIANSGLPLPLASVHNKRSLIYVGNLCHAIERTIGHEKAKNQIFLVSDRNDLSTPDLIRCIVSASARPERLFRFPQAVLSLFASLGGQKAKADRLLGSLQVNSDKIHRLLDWTPPYNVVQGMEQTVRANPETHG